MKIFTKVLTALCIFTLGFSSNIFGVNYVSSGAGPADWSVSTTWTPNGIPTTSDNVTILSGHTVNISANGNVCNNLTVSGTLAWTANVTLSAYGNYSVTATGVESAPIFGKLAFFPPGTTVSVTGTSSSKLYYNFASSRTILAGSSITKNNAITTIGASKTVTNLGSYIMGNTTLGAGCAWINSTNSSLSLRLTGFMAGKTFTASASGNTVTLTYVTGALPTTTGSTFYNLTIAGASGAKTLAAVTTISHNLTINSNNTLNSNNFDLNVGGNWTSNGTFTASAGKVVNFNGSATTQNVSNTLGTTTFKGLTVNNINGVTLTSGTYLLDEVLTVTAGTFNTGGRPFTMTSTAAKTARIAPLGASGAISGNFTIQRYIGGRIATYADLSSPVQSSTFADWANATELPFISFNSSPPTRQASINTYDEAADAYAPVTNSGTSMNPGQGFEIFISGAYDTTTAFPTTTINTVGTPNQGDHDLSGSISNSVQGWNLVGNPFASNILWSTIYNDAGTSGLYDFIEMWDYTIKDWNGYTTGDAIEIGATQGFWVYGLPGNGAVTLNIPESSKTATANSSIKSNNRIQPYFTLKLTNTADGASHLFKVATDASASDGLDIKDIPFHSSPNASTPQLYSFVDGKKININTFNSNNDNYSMQLSTQVTVAGTYKIEASGFDFVSDYTCIKLEDKLLNKTIDLTAENSYSFEMNPSDNRDRFIAHFSKNNSCKSFASANMISDFSNQIEVLPTSQGNVINFNLSETTNSTISVMNLLGQTIVEGVSVEANTQSVNIALPQDFSGMYIVKIASAKGTVTKKFVRK